MEKQLPDINLLKAIVAAAGGSIKLSNEVYQNYLSMDLDEFVLEFSDDGEDTTMILKYRTIPIEE